MFFAFHLPQPLFRLRHPSRVLCRVGGGIVVELLDPGFKFFLTITEFVPQPGRSEERRVGKECLE